MGSGPMVEHLFDRLEREDVRTVFGVPGGPLTGFFEQMRARERLNFVLAKHEQGAGFMANAFARVRRKLAVVAASSGPGATNMATALASARADSLPILLITGQVATRTFGKGAFQESTRFGTDLVKLFEPLTKLSVEVPSAERLPHYLDHAIRLATTGRWGPVHLALPADFYKQQIVAPAPAASRGQGSAFDLAALEEAASRLAKARTPVILAGNGVSLAGAENELRRVAELLGAPVATTPKGKGCFPERHPLSLGVYGLGGHPRAFRCLHSGSADVLLVVGSSLGEFSSLAWDDRLLPTDALLQLDIDPAELGKNFPVQVGIQGEARAALTRLGNELAARRSEPARGVEAVSAMRKEVPEHEGEELFRATDARLTPPRLMRELREALPDDGRLWADIGNAMLWGPHYFEVRQTGTYFIDLGLASMGSAAAGAIGGKLADPSRPVVALVGDSAFAMNGVEVHTAAELGLNVVWVVLNNAGHGMITQGETILRGSDLGYGRFTVPLDVATMARGLGARGVRVETAQAFRTAMDEALREKGPTVIDAIIDASVVPPTLGRRAESLARYLGLPVGTRIGPAGDTR